MISVTPGDHALPLSAHLLADIAFINATLRAIVATHPAPAQLDAALDGEFERVLAPTAQPEFTRMRDTFRANLRARGHHHE